MGKVVAGITISVDGYITGLSDGPGCGLGVGGERLHYWVFGGPWSYDSPGRGEPSGQDKAWLNKTMSANGAVIAGRGTYEAAGHWGGKNPWGVPLFVVTHRPAEQPPGGDFIFAGTLGEAIDRATAAADRKAPDGPPPTVRRRHATDDVSTTQQIAPRQLRRRQPKAGWR